MEPMQWIITIDGQRVRQPMSLDEARIWQALLCRCFPHSKIAIISWN